MKRRECAGAAVWHHRRGSDVEYTPVSDVRGPLKRRHHRRDERVEAVGDGDLRRSIGRPRGDAGGGCAAVDPRTQHHAARHHFRLHVDRRQRADVVHNNAVVARADRREHSRQRTGGIVGREPDVADASGGVIAQRVSRPADADFSVSVAKGRQTGTGAVEPRRHIVEAGVEFDGRSCDDVRILRPAEI